MTNYWKRRTQGYSRRDALRVGSTAGVGLATLGLIGCGNDDDDNGDVPDNGDDGNRVVDDRDIEVPVPRDEGRLLEMFPYDWDEPEEAQTGGRLRVAATWDVSTWDPRVTQSGGTNTVANIVYNRIMKFDLGPGYSPYEIHIEPDLAEGYELSDDGLTYTFRLHPGIHWQDVAPLDGRALTAEDIMRCYEQYGESGVNTGIFAAVDHMETPDDDTLVVHLTEPSPSFLNEISSRYVPIFPPELVEDDSIDTAAVGTGPFILESATTGEGVLLVKNPDYFEGEPYLDEVEFLVRPDASTRLAMFRSDQIEYGYGFATDLRELDDVLESDPDTRVGMVQNIGITKFSIAGRHDDPDSPWRDARVRKAISRGIDRNAVIEIVNEGLGGPDGCLPWPWVMDDPPTMDEMGENFQYDPEDARQLLEAAGYEDLNLTINFFEYASALRTEVETLMDQLRAIGANLQLGDMDYTTFNSQWIGAEYEELVYGWWAFAHEADSWAFQNMHSESPSNRHTIDDPELDRLIMDQRHELDPEARQDILRDIWDHFNEEMPSVLLTQGAVGYDLQAPTLHNLRFGGFAHSFYDWGQQLPRVWVSQA